MNHGGRQYVQQLMNKTQGGVSSYSQTNESPYVYNKSVHDNSFNFYEAGGSNPNNIKQRFFQQHYRHIYPGGTQSAL